MIKPEQPNVDKAQAKLALIFPHMAELLVRSLRNANGESALPRWREDQLVKFVKALSLYANDLNSVFNGGRIDTIAMATRNLTELGIWVRYCNLSEEYARRFLEDSVRDFREILETLQKLYTAENGGPEDAVTQLLKNFHQVATSFGMKNVGQRYMQVRDAAKEVGKPDAFNYAYKIFSKLAHPTSLFLTFEPETGALSTMIGAFYVNGVHAAVTTFNELVAFIDKTFNSGLASGQPSNTASP